MSHDEDPWATAESAAAVLSDWCAVPGVAVVAGSGWAAAGTGLGSVESELAHDHLPGVPAPTVTGHVGRLQLVRLAGNGDRVVVVSGRSHLYEGHSAATVVHLVRSLVMAGASTVVLTNAAGSLRSEVGPGRVSLVSDHLNLTGSDPMAGPAPPAGRGGRFVDLTHLYDPELRERVLQRRPELAEGVYAGLRGSSFETPAEIRMLRTLGADLVGMSTVLEAIAARQLGARVVACALVSNLAAGMQDHIDHGEVLDVAARSTEELTAVLADVAAVVLGR